MDYDNTVEGSFDKPDDEEDEASMNPNDFLSFAVNQMLKQPSCKADDDDKDSMGSLEDPSDLFAAAHGDDDVLIDEQPPVDQKPNPTLASILAQSPNSSSFAACTDATTPWSTANPPANFGPIRTEISEFRPRNKAEGPAFRKGPRNVLHRRRLVYQDVDERFETPEDFKKWWDGGACAGWVYNSTYRTQMDEEIRVFRCSVKFCPHRIRVAYNINTKAVRVELSTIGHQHGPQAKDEIPEHRNIVPMPKSEIDYATSQLISQHQQQQTPKLVKSQPNAQLSGTPRSQAAAVVSTPNGYRMPTPNTVASISAAVRMMTPSRAVPPQPRRHPPPQQQQQQMMPPHMRPQMPPHLFPQRPMPPPICPEYRQQVERLMDAGLSANTIHMALMEETIKRIPTVDQIELLIRMREAAANTKESRRRNEPDLPKYAPSMAVLHQGSPSIPFSSGGNGFPPTSQQKPQNSGWLNGFN